MVAELGEGFAAGGGPASEGEGDIARGGNQWFGFELVNCAASDRWKEEEEAEDYLNVHEWEAGCLTLERMSD